ncbi:CBS domain-containing protein [Sphingobium boeckii]|uniref:CBS domain-containing protein n=1 Tax=Sphingobium boeckii TaxID=1082345 RepID=A0A7W9EE31_9SPHN|nr:CBS domain-containing protein [Sphingobium boeckii]MBB5684261.1 CBS domain-containing protein [Sphingobium boeckii]
MTIGNIVEAHDFDVITIAADERVGTAIKLLAEKRIGALPVVDGGAVLGIFSERDVIYGLQREGHALLDRAVSEVMTAPAVTVDPGQSVLGALSLMTKRRIRHLPVVSGGALIGFVSIGDLVKHRMDRIESEANAMRDYIQGS